MNETHYISGFSVVRNNKVSVNDKLDYVSESLSFVEFIKAAYRHYDLKYPKFFKMDNLCKLAMIGSQALLNEVDISQFQKEKVGIVLMNRASSLDTDRKHQESIDDKEHYFPSPAIFVYTLSNIMIGEIAIKHQLKGENACFVSDNLNTELLYNYVSNLFNKKKIEACICGWVDFDNENYESALALIEKTNRKNITFEVNSINHIYKS